MGKVARVRIAASALLVLVLVSGWLMIGPFSRKPDDLGVRGGTLKACPDSPNCVSSQADSGDRTHFAPPLDFDGEPDAAFERLLKSVNEMPRTEVTERTESYAHVEFTSAIMRYVDDVEFLLDRDAGVIHVRSASRVGYSDMGTNRSRVEKIRKAFIESKSSGE